MVKRLATECRSSPPTHIVRLDGYGNLIQIASWSILHCVNILYTITKFRKKEFALFHEK